MEFPTLERELELMANGYIYVAGIDEAGRGPWAGPVTAGCTIVLNETQMVDGVRDSKKMSHKQRIAAYDLIKEKSAGWGIGIVTAKEIDEIGIQEAVLRAMTEALSRAEKMVGSKANYIIADGMGIRMIESYKMEKIKAGDAYHYSIAAGSVLAKVARDNLMAGYALKYPKYGFESHVGYGTKAHREALDVHGPCEIHRKSYKPIAALLN